MSYVDLREPAEASIDSISRLTAREKLIYTGLRFLDALTRSFAEFDLELRLPYLPQHGQCQRLFIDFNIHELCGRIDQ